MLSILCARLMLNIRLAARDRQYRPEVHFGGMPSSLTAKHEGSTAIDFAREVTSTATTITMTDDVAHRAEVLTDVYAGYAASSRGSSLKTVRGSPPPTSPVSPTQTSLYSIPIYPLLPARPPISLSLSTLPPPVHTSSFPASPLPPTPTSWILRPHPAITPTLPLRIQPKPPPARTRSWKIRQRSGFYGPPKEPDFSMVSLPPLPRDEVV